MTSLDPVKPSVVIPGVHWLPGMPSSKDQRFDSKTCFESLGIGEDWAIHRIGATKVGKLGGMSPPRQVDSQWFGGLL